MAPNITSMGLITKQGDIFLSNLDPVKGHEQAGLRPVLILQNDALNDQLNTVIVAPITSNMSLKGFMTTYFITRNFSGLAADSLVLLFQIRTLDKTRLLRKIGQITSLDSKKILNKLSFVF